MTEQVLAPVPGGRRGWGRARRGMLGLGLVAVLLAGCGGAGDPGTAAPATPAATATPTVEIPDVPLPVLPDEAREYTSDSAIAFVHYLVDVINRAYVTGDTASLLALGTADCPTCQRTADDIDAVYERGNAYRGGAVSLVRTDWVALGADLGERGVPTVPSVVDIAELTEVAPDGTVVETFPGVSDRTLLWDLAWQEERWLLADVRGPKRS